MRQRRRLLALVTAVAAAVLGLAAVQSDAAGAPHPLPSARPAGLGTTEQALVRLRLPDRAAVESLVASGADLTTARPLAGGAYQVDGVFTGAELDVLAAHGARLLQTIERAGDGTARYLASTERAAAADVQGMTPDAAGGGTDTLHFLQAYWWQSKGHIFTSAEVATTAIRDPDVEIRIRWSTADGQHG